MVWCFKTNEIRKQTVNATLRVFTIHYLLLSYLLTPLSTVLLEQPTGSQLVKKLPAFYVTRRLIIAFTRAHHLSQYSARSIKSKPPSHFLKIHLNIILPFTPLLSSIHSTCPSHLIYCLLLLLILKPQNMDNVQET